MPTELRAKAERWLRGVYFGDVTVVDEIGAEEVLISYPVFQKAVGTPVLRGRAAVREFAKRFASRWTDGELEVNEAIEGENAIVLIWSFQARNAVAAQEGGSSEAPFERWGGISLLRFNEAGRLTAEIGEESDPGPYGRLKEVE